MDNGTPPGSATFSPYDAQLQWHHRYWGIFFLKFRQVLSIELSIYTLECESYQLGKHHRTSYPNRVNNSSSSLFDLVHSDI